MKLKLFEKLHNTHPMQTINLNEIPKDYVCVDIKIGEEREETLLEIQEMLAKESLDKKPSEIIMIPTLFGTVEELEKRHKELEKIVKTIPKIDIKKLERIKENNDN